MLVNCIPIASFCVTVSARKRGISRGVLCYNTGVTEDDNYIYQEQLFSNCINANSRITILFSVSPPF